MQRSWTSWLRKFLLILSAALLPVLIPTAPAHAVPVYPVPDPDVFYSPTPDIADRANGDVLRSRFRAAPGYLGGTAWQIAFRSTNSAGSPITAVTTVLLPPGGGANRPLVSYQPFINSLGTRCAPSHSLFDGSLQEAPALNLLLARGWAVAVPDHLGPVSAYGAAKLGGQITLDSIRAAKRFAPAGLGASPVAMAGYSGGGMATAWASVLAPSYAPELPLVGAAQGGVPAEIGQLALDVGGRPSPLFGLGFAAAIGLEREYPRTVKLAAALKPAGVALRDQVVNACADQIIAAGANKSYHDVAAGPMTVDPQTAAVLHQNSVGMHPGVPRIPVYAWHGSNDFVSPRLAQQLAGKWCRGGGRVLFEFFAGDHGAAIAPGSARAFQYIADRFAGLPAPANC